MRWSRAIITFGLCASVLNLTACKSEKSDQSAKLDAAKTPAKTAEKTLTPQEQAERASLPAGQLCYRDLCAAKKELSYPTMVELAASASPEQKKYYDDYISALMLKTVEERNLSSKLLVDLLHQNQDKLHETQLNEGQQRMVKAMLLVISSKHLPEQVHTAFRQKMATYDFMKGYFRSNVKGPQGFFDVLYPQVPIKQAALSEVEKILELQDKINGTMNARIIDLEMGSLARIKSGEGIDTDDLTSMIGNSIALRMLEVLLIKDTALADSMPLDQDKIKQIFRNAKVAEMMQSRINKSGLLPVACERNFYKAINLYPQNSEIGAFKETSEKVRAQVLTMLSPQDPAYEVIRNAPLYMPADAKTIATRWTTRLKDFMQDARQERENFKKLDNASLVVLGTIFSLIYTDEDKICSEVADLNISDATNTIDKGIKVSWLSVKSPAYGISILAHELGHLVSKYSNSFASQKVCLADKNASLYVEEDFADVIAAKASLQLQNTLSTKQGNFGCLFASVEQTPALKNADPHDVHASGLYRAIQIAQLRKESLPESCKTALQQEAPKALNACE
ncbi:hypothetical protein [Bdellovibrio bacteriovorus]|uniref:hypothetical protein n=1 Tax=Bdellovibrio bacteriovorus TaxID=959 RepID=UPI0035A951FF